MGKGDKRSRRGKIVKGTSGVRRLSKRNVARKKAAKLKEQK
ncbi:MAG: 30S ribosomal protein THX [Bacteroidales bacterium]|jgi:ribosomal small subunit protein bTHX|nr:30S ribosomal protein THX [Bacteroidales bacterium]NMB70974.1 30S ribosomal protein THX [Bacteroidales bacterium]HQH40319.1 30S ribosomal protein THX [Bacteroidales bacterium]HQK37712.1 30S ribosomal protein THX [Bacteroidales bacterium]